MGLIDSTQNINKEIQAMANINQEKESKSEVNARLERKLEQKLWQGFEELGSQAIYYFYSVKNREKVIQELGSSDYEYVRLNKLFDKVLKRVFKVFKNDEKYRNWNAHF